jgi:hypothetical protein
MNIKSGQSGKGIFNAFLNAYWRTDKPVTMLLLFIVILVLFWPILLGVYVGVKRLLEKSGHRKPFEVIKRTEGSGRSEELENLLLQTIKKERRERFKNR